jgi:hypothetical protein
LSSWQDQGHPEYPISNGDFATFDGASGALARTAMGKHFSLFSDSAWNLGSQAYYRQEFITSSSNQGFLRFFYQLNSGNEKQPYVGLYADLSELPPRGFDISQF